jgi:hypothetical protein
MVEVVSVLVMVMMMMVMMMNQMWTIMKMIEHMLKLQLIELQYQIWKLH